MLAELEDVLSRPKFAARLKTANRNVQEVVDNFAFVATIVKAQEIEPVVIRDPDDDAVIACAVASQSEVIVSGDRDLLDLGMYNGIRVLRAMELLSEIEL